jgi:amidase, hydantoinase/carbamoylase family
MFTCSEKRMEDKITTFSKFGDTGHGGVTRYSLSPAACAARAEFKKRMEAIGCTVVTDDLACMYATLPGTDPDAPAILAGSHLDSVLQGGNYDGVLGVLTAMEALETVAAEKIPHRHPLTAVVWTNEEGSRFEPAMMCSGILTGKFDKAAMLASVAKDTGDITFGEALEASGYKGSEKNRIDPKKTLGLLELHIEQGPVLEAEGYEIGVVEGVCGMINYEITFEGQADHAGTTPMSYRKDALFACAKTLEYLHTECDKLDGKLVYTTGKIYCHPNIHTIIPDKVDLTIDARHQDPAVVEQVVEIIKKIPPVVEKCKTSYKEAWSRKTVQYFPEYIDDVEESAGELGYKARRIYSGPGHDAQYLCELVPTTMIFVPSKDGHSHCELEHTSVELCTKGASVLLNTILKIDKK